MHQVCAVELGFMSTSRNSHTPIAYMGATGQNVLWKVILSHDHSSRKVASALVPPHPPSTFALRDPNPQVQPKLQSDVAFHVGADISFLSQFSAEEEILFPPLYQRTHAHTHTPP